MEKDNDSPPEAPALKEDEMSEAEIDETLIESFPASDPPSWTLGIEPHANPNNDQESKDIEDDPASEKSGGH